MRSSTYMVDGKFWGAGATFWLDIGRLDEVIVKDERRRVDLGIAVREASDALLTGMAVEGDALEVDA